MALFGLIILTKAPLTCVQVPLPREGSVAFNIVVVVPVQIFSSAPANAVSFGKSSTSTVVILLAGESHPLAVTIA